MIETANLRVLLECHALKQSIGNGNADWEGDDVTAQKHILKGLVHRLDAL